MSREEYQAQTAKTRAARMQWWHEARFGMFVHWACMPKWAATNG